MHAQLLLRLMPYVGIGRFILKFLRILIIRFHRFIFHRTTLEIHCFLLMYRPGAIHEITAP